MYKFDKVTTISVCGLMIALFGRIQISVWPLNKGMDGLENKMDRLEVKFEKRMDDIEDKLDQVLFELKGLILTSRLSKQRNKFLRFIVVGIKHIDWKMRFNAVRKLWVIV